MALITLINLGALLGWLGSIIMRLEIPGAVLRMMFVGIVASLTAGLITNGGTVLGSVSWLALGVAAVATIPAIVGYYFFATRAV
jgi:uncharacterized membrane protein YeaQ/YmgE (transglycosylase-associated protein family)